MATAPGEVVIGAVYPLSGPDVALGRNAVEGLRFGWTRSTPPGIRSLGGARLRLEFGTMRRPRSEAPPRPRPWSSAGPW